MKIGVVLPNWIGDVVMATPALRAIQRHFGDRATLVGIMRPYVSEVLDGTPWLSQRIYCDPHSGPPQLKVWPVVRQLRRLRLDYMVLLTNSLTTGAMAWLSGARRRVGYVRYGRGPLLTDKLYPPRSGWQWAPISAVDYYLGLAYLLGCPPESRKLELATTEEDEQAADRVWARLRLPGAEGVVTLCPAGAYGPAKHWPADYFAALARRIVETYDCKVLLVYGPAELPTAHRIQERARHERVLSLAGEQLSIGLSKACLRRSRMVIATDSGPRHMATALGVRTIALFGPTDPRWTSNGQGGEILLREHIPCSPCGKRVCPLVHHRCMRQLSVDTVFDAVRKLWDAGPARRAA